jgi:AcrR family transcriptional regulator
MRVPSTSATSARRKPQQERAALRRAQFLETAALLIAENGFEMVTMTAIAERAGASIGALYDYFPDKKAIGTALMAQYASEVVEHWAPLLTRAASMTHEAFADGFIETMLEFSSQRPAYISLSSANLSFTRDPAARRAIRMKIAEALQALAPSLQQDEALIAANVLAQQVKAHFAMHREAAPKDRALYTAEFKKILRLYIADVVRRK